jgi:hypothetical protein
MGMKPSFSFRGAEAELATKRLKKLRKGGAARPFKLEVEVEGEAGLLTTFGGLAAGIEDACSARCRCLVC